MPLIRDLEVELTENLALDPFQQAVIGRANVKATGITGAQANALVLAWALSLVQDCDMTLLKSGAT